MDFEPIENYLSNVQCRLPFFCVVGDADYVCVCNRLRQIGLCEIRMSDHSSNRDKYPSVDSLMQTLKSRDGNLFVIGMGESLALRGEESTLRALLELKDKSFSGKKVIFLVRGIAHQASTMIRSDQRLLQRHRAYVADSCATELSIVTMPPAGDTSPSDTIQKPSNTIQDPYNSIQSLIKAMEDGVTGTLYVRTQLDLRLSLFPVKTLKDDYDIIEYQIKTQKHQLFHLPKTLGTAEQWRYLRVALDKQQYDIQRVFDCHINTHITNPTWTDMFTDDMNINWLQFLNYKQNSENISNIYLKQVIDMTDDFQKFKQNLLEYFAEIKPDHSQFEQLYRDRKALFRNISDSDIKRFIQKNEIHTSESIFRLTDRTLAERQAILKWLSHNDCDEKTWTTIQKNYPALSMYLSFYAFDCPRLSEELTSYFDTYKRLKVTNRLPDDFLQTVNAHADNKSYIQLETRDNAIKNIDNKAHAKLYWIDALGVEYLSFITSLAKQKGLSLHIDICRSDLPTITSLNKSFYDNWNFDKYKESRLDELKHKEKGNYFYTSEKSPIHLAEELDIIAEAVDIAENDLKGGKYQSFIIASDHGASRLSVLNNNEVPYDTDTKGEHSGRCCPYFEGCHAPHQFIENGYIVLSDYGRFRGSRKANVEVHGGASLEEIVVPVMTLTLKTHISISLEVCNPNDITANGNDGVILEIYLSQPCSPEKLVLIIDKKKYHCLRPKDDHHFLFQLKDITRARTEPYTANVYDGNNDLGSLSFKVKSRSAKIVNDFDFDDDF